MSKHRYDIRFGQFGPSIDLHFCRESTVDGGCYGTDLTHGFSFAEAAKAIVEYHESQAKQWRKMTEDMWLAGNGIEP